MDDMRIFAKLRLAGLAALLGMVLVGAVGAFTAMRLDHLTHRIADEAMNPIAQLGRINELMEANLRELLGAANHNPSLGAAKYHDHPPTMHLDGIEANIRRISESWAAYEASQTLDAALVKAYQEKRAMFIQDGLRKGMEMARAGQFEELAIHVTVSALPLFRSAKDDAERLYQLHDALGRQLEDEAVSLKQTSFLLLGGGVVIISIVVVAVMTLIARGITLPMAQVVGALGRLAEGDVAHEVPGGTRKDELGDVSRAADVLRRNEIKRRELERQAEADRAAREERAARISRLTQEFDSRVVDVIGNVASAVATLEHSAQSMSSVSDQTTRQAGAVAAASEEASSNVQTVAAASEELSASSNEIASQVVKASEIAQTAATEASATDELVQGLSESAARIGDVVDLINTIASQTNLLALNATIEAARAGDAGKGFAVVANEVKHLATQTGKATQEIGTQITAVQTKTEQAVRAIRAIGAIIEEMNQISSAIATAVEEQGAATQEIARNIAEAHSGTAEVARHIGGVTEGARESSASAKDVLDAAQGLNLQSQALRSVVDAFLAGVRDDGAAA
jgi:methyl-accepting chemotaxis protein